MVRSRGYGRIPACHSIEYGYVQGRTSGKFLTNNPKLAKWTLDGLFGKHKKTAAFSQKAKNYLLDVCWTGEETSKAIGLLTRSPP